jgi:hypothetical protein
MLQKFFNGFTWLLIQAAELKAKYEVRKAKK